MLLSSIVAKVHASKTTDHVLSYEHVTYLFNGRHGHSVAKDDPCCTQETSTVASISFTTFLALSWSKVWAVSPHLCQSVKHTEDQ